MVGIKLRDEKTPELDCSLWASLNAGGNLVLAGQDLGRGTAMVSSDGEYEYWITVKAENISQLRALLHASADADVLQVLADQWAGERSHDLERLIRDGVPHEFFCYSG